MTLKKRLAKWLYPDVFERAEFWERANENNIEWRHRVVRETRIAKERVEKTLALKNEYNEALSRALHNIIALKTPKCAHAARRMADIAEAALSQPNLPTREEG